MLLNIWALTIIKALGLGYPAAQLVFLRAAVGLVLMLPWVLRSRHAFTQIDRLGLHLARVVLSTLALSASFFAISRLPFALFSAISFTRPFVMIMMAVIFLGETIGARRWAAAAVAFVGVIIAIQPGAIPFTWGVPVMFLTVLFGTGAIIVTRRLAGTPTVVMMAAYTSGLMVLSAPVAIWTWVPIASEHLVVLLSVGVFAQLAQFCFLRAHAKAEVGFLAILGYSSLLLTTAVGYLVFDEHPGIAFFAGAILIIAAAVAATLGRARLTGPQASPPK